MMLTDNIGIIKILFVAWCASRSTEQIMALIFCKQVRKKQTEMAGDAQNSILTICLKCSDPNFNLLNASDYRLMEYILCFS